jgi:hypothetical protein
MKAWGGDLHSAKGPGGQSQGVPGEFSVGLVSLERVPGVRKGVQRGPVGPPRPPSDPPGVISHDEGMLLCLPLPLHITNLQARSPCFVLSLPLLLLRFLPRPLLRLKFWSPCI